ncbi:hypothetical protein V8D89_003230 [Ganoderma adspersum]
MPPDEMRMAPPPAPLPLQRHVQRNDHHRAAHDPRVNNRGSVLVNPGGPGGSGTELVGVLGQNLSTIVGDKFDVLGFDPPGIGPQAL